MLLQQGGRRRRMTSLIHRAYTNAPEQTLGRSWRGVSAGDCHDPADSSGAASNRRRVIFIYQVESLESLEIIQAPSVISVCEFCCAQLFTFTQASWKQLLGAGSVGFTIYRPQSIGRAAQGWHSQQGSTHQHTHAHPLLVARC